jgi:hypothetical protein
MTKNIKAARMTRAGPAVRIGMKVPVLATVMRPQVKIRVPTKCAMHCDHARRDAWRAG